MITIMMIKINANMMGKIVMVTVLLTHDGIN